MPSKLILLLMLLLPVLSLPVLAGDAVTLTMAYRTTEKLPFIAEAPDNRGMFADMFGEAARRSGMTLKIQRMPKTRVLNALNSGEVDFYPQFTFNTERNAYAFFAPNGLQVSYSAISRLGIPPLNSARQFDGLTLLHGLGNPDYLTKLGYGAAKVSRIEVAEMDLAKAILMIQKGRADAYIYEAEPLAHALLMSGAKDIQLHTNLSDRVEWATLGVSRKSRWLSLEPNPDYLSGLQLSAQNQPERLVVGSPFAKLVLALEEMRQDGTLDRLSEEYLGPAPEAPGGDESP